MSEFAVPFLLGILAAASPPPRDASPEGWTIAGTVWNRTRGVPATVKRVALIEVEPEMALSAEAREVTGTFRFEEVPGGRTYAIHTVHNGVPYLALVPQPDASPIGGHGAGRAPVSEVDLSVYETTEDASAVEAFLPHVFLERSPEGIAVRCIYRVENRSSPPVTLSNSEGTFRFGVPRGSEGTTQVSVEGLLKVWTSVVPISRGKDGEFRIDAAMRPGVTRVSVESILPVTGERARFDQVLPFAVQRIGILVSPSRMKITGKNLREMEIPGSDRLRALEAGPFRAGEHLRFRVELNDLRWVVSPNRVTGVRLFILGGTSVLLLLLILGCLRRPSPRGAVPAPGTREEGIRAIAELDGCFERGERDEREYWIQRIALKKWVAAHPNPEESDPPPPGRGKTG